MKRLISLLCCIVTVAFCNFNADAQSLMQIARQAEQQAKELKQQEASRYNSIVDSKDLTKYNQFIADYPCGKNTPEIKRRIAELEAWNSAQLSNTVIAYETYINNSHYRWFSSDAMNAIRNIKQAEEKEAWSKVVTENTVEAYQRYISMNASSGYREEAEKSIRRLQASAEWPSVRLSSDVSVVENFIEKYPDVEEIYIANQKLHELKGCQYYNSGNLSSAYTEFSQVRRCNLSPENRDAYDKVMEYEEFSTLSSNSRELELLIFLEKYPNSVYYNQVCSMIALSKARNFSMDATADDYKEALRYAKDNATRQSVQLYVNSNKKIQKARKNEWKSYERQQNGGMWNFGLDFLNLGFGLKDSEDGTIVYYDFGLLLRIGNYADRLQFAFGLKPGILGYDEESKSSYYSDTDFKTAFHMPVLGQLKLNIAGIGSAWLYCYGMYQYNAVKVSKRESDMAWGFGFGVAWKHLDWSYYYRMDIGNPKDSNYGKQQYLGMSLIYYWQL